MKDELILSNNNKFKRKIYLNSDIDLYKIPMKTLKQTKLSDFNGQLIFDLLTEMMNDNIIFSPKNKSRNIIINKSGQKNYFKNIYNENEIDNNTYPNSEIMHKFVYINDIRQLKIEKINFQIKYDTKFGEDLAVIGSIKELGNWKIDRALKMGWNENNIWKGTLYLDRKNIFEFEYKFIVTSGNYVKRWEDGFNRKFDLFKLKALFDSYPGNYTRIHLNNIEGINIDYDIIDNTLTMICFWNIK